MIIPVVTEDMIYFSKLKSLTSEKYELLHIKRSEDMDKLNLNNKVLVVGAKGKLFGEGNAKLPLPPMLMMDRIVKITKN